jgi:hypothetical protein
MIRSLLSAALIPLSTMAAARDPVIPTEEADVLAVAVIAAVALASAGRAADGYTALLAALRRAEATDAPWSAALAARYRQVMRAYARRHGIALD